MLMAAAGTALLLAVSGAASLSVLTPTQRVIGLSSIGGFRTSGSYHDATRHFAALSVPAGRATFRRGSCSLRYRQLGLTLWWIGNPLTKGTARSCTHFEEAVVSGHGWHTAKGLSIGDSTKRLVRLYPHAYNTRRAGPKWATRGSVEWDITITCCGGGERPALSVMVQSSTIDAIFVRMVGR